MRKLMVLLFAVLVVNSSLVRADTYPTSGQAQAPDTEATTPIPEVAPAPAPEVAPAPDTEATAPTPEVAPTPTPEVAPASDTETTAPTPEVAPSVFKKAADDASIPQADHAAIGDGLMALVGGSLVFLLLAILAGLLLYMLPTVIARSRGHRNSFTIGFLNFFTGWTLLGWIGCLVWAVTEPGLNTPKS